MEESRKPTPLRLSPAPSGLWFKAVVHIKAAAKSKGPRWGWRGPEYILIHVLYAAVRGAVDGLGSGKLAFDHLTMAKLTPRPLSIGRNLGTTEHQDRIISPIYLSLLLNQRWFTE